MSKHYLDITKEHCPMTFVKARLKMEELKAGEELDILLCEGEPLQNVPRSVEECGGRILAVEKVGDRYLLKIVKQ